MFEKTLIRGASVVDGTGSQPFRADVSIHGGVIDEIGRISKNKECFSLVIDACGLTLCPGFIDMHSHSDLVQMEKPLASAKIRQGITTEVLGQDGLGAAPLSEGSTNDYRRHVSGLLGNPSLEWRWRSFGDYLECLEKAKTASNLAILASHGPIRISVMGTADRPASAAELNKMGNVLTEAFEQGAFGFSTGLIYPPCLYATEEELVGLAEVTQRNKGFFVAHVRNERSEVIDSICEMMDLGRKTGVPIHISHLKIIGRENWGRAGELLALFDNAKTEGRDATFDQYPYPAGSTMLSILLPPGAHSGGPESLLQRLQNRDIRMEWSQQMENGLPGWENISTAAGWDGILVTGVNAGLNKKWEGRTLADIANDKRTSPQEVVFDLLIEEQLQVSMVNFSLSEDDVRRIMQHSNGMLGTDGLLSGKPHPRAYGSTARILGRYVRENKVLSLTEAVERMTLRPARRLGLTDRGVVTPGAKADLVLFESGKILDTASFTDPCQFPVGVEYVFVNGAPAVAKGIETGVLSGRVLRKR